MTYIFVNFYLENLELLEFPGIFCFKLWGQNYKKTLTYQNKLIYFYFFTQKLLLLHSDKENIQIKYL